MIPREVALTLYRCTDLVPLILRLYFSLVSMFLSFVASPEEQVSSCSLMSAHASLVISCSGSGQPQSDTQTLCICMHVSISNTEQINLSIHIHSSVSYLLAYEAFAIQNGYITKLFNWRHNNGFAFFIRRYMIYNFLPLPYMTSLWFGCLHVHITHLPWFPKKIMLSIDNVETFRLMRSS